MVNGHYMHIVGKYFCWPVLCISVLFKASETEHVFYAMITKQLTFRHFKVSNRSESLFCRRTLYLPFPCHAPPVQQPFHRVGSLQSMTKIFDISIAGPSSDSGWSESEFQLPNKRARYGGVVVSKKFL